MLFYLASNGALPNQTNGASAENVGAEKGKKRANEEGELASAPQSKAARRSLGSTARVEEVKEEEKVVQEVKKKGRRSLAVVPTTASPAGRLVLNNNCLFYSL